MKTKLFFFQTFQNKALLFQTSLFVAFATNALQAQTHFKIRNDEFIQIGSERYKTLTFGQETNSPNNGRYAIEHSNNGLNFWKPWPTWNASNFVLFLRDDLSVGIGTQGSSSFKLDVAGSIRCTSISYTSDKRLKTNIQPLKNTLHGLMGLQAIQFQYTFPYGKYDGIDVKQLSETQQKTIESDKASAPQTTHYGLIAQDVQTVFPHLVTQDDKGYLSVDYVGIVPILIEAIQTQQQQINRLEQRIKDLETSKK